MRADPAPQAGLRRVLAAIPAASGAMVMGTGIVSIALSLDRHETLSRVILVIAAVAWVALGLLLLSRLLGQRELVRRETRTPAALTGVAATAVLGTRLELLDWSWAGIAMLVIALALWLLLLGPVLAHWVTPTTGISLILTVSTQSLAVLSTVLAVKEHADWLFWAALAPFLLGLAFYVLVIWRFDLRQLLIGNGDHWITGGALAISTLAAGRITLAEESLHLLAGTNGALEVVSLVLWGLTMAWLPALVLAEALRPRLHYSVRRFSTVFPVGMYAACSFVIGKAAGAPAITDFAHVWVWAGLAVWLIVLAGMIARGAALAQGRTGAAAERRPAASSAGTI